MEESQPVTVPAVTVRKKLLWCCDGDGTLYLGNSHNLVCQALERDPSLGELRKLNNEEWRQKVWGIVKDSLTPLEPKDKSLNWKIVVNAILESGDDFTITSHNAFGPIIFSLFFEKIVGLDKAFIEKNIHIVSFLPTERKDLRHKQFHIEQAKEELGLADIDSECVVVIDDNLDIINAASRAGYFTITAKPDGEHLKGIMRMLKFMQHQETQTAVDENLWRSGGSSSSKDAELLIKYSSKSPSPVIGRGPLTCSREYSENSELKRSSSPKIN